MYVTRRLSMYKRSPDDLSLPPPEGPNSGILVIKDEETTCCFGLSNIDMIKELPLPQNKSLELYYAVGFYPNRELQFHSVFFIPVLGQPLSSNRYYAVYPFGKDRGEGYTSANEYSMDMETCCFDSCTKDVLPQRFDPNNMYQQYKINLHKKVINISGGFVARSMAKDGFPPQALWRRGWKLRSSTSPGFELGDAPGLDTALRARLPDFNFPLKNVVVGKWYCPFMFVNEGTPKTLIDIRNRSMYYEMTLEQRWEEVFVKDHSFQCGEGNAARVDFVVQSEVVMVGGMEGRCDGKKVGDDDGLVLYRSLNNVGQETRVGVSVAIFERMKWEQGRVGWVGGEEGTVRVERVEDYGGVGEWKKLGFFVLVERFALKRMNGDLVFSHDFRHAHQIRTKWE